LTAGVVAVGPAAADVVAHGAADADGDAPAAAADCDADGDAQVPSADS